MTRTTRFQLAALILAITAVLWILFGTGLLLMVLRDNPTTAERLTVGAFVGLIYLAITVAGFGFAGAAALDWIKKADR